MSASSAKQLKVMSGDKKSFCPELSKYNNLTTNFEFKIIFYEKECSESFPSASVSTATEIQRGNHNTSCVDQESQF